MAYLVRTPSSAGNRKTFTMSAWIKPTNISSSNSISMFSAWSADNVAGHFVWRIKPDGTIGWSRWGDDSYSTRKLRDENGWYHCVIAVDTTQATASNRIKLYVNNEQITSFSVGAIYPAQNTDLPVNNTNSQTIGLNNYSSSGNPYTGYMSHFHLVDGTALTPSAFGETDATTGEWKIKTSPSVTYGTNGFFMFKDDNSANDNSGQGNNFTLNGTLTKTEDCPSNVFATINALDNLNVGGTLSNGNNTITTGTSEFGHTSTTLGASSGKYYCEIKHGSGNPRIGVAGKISTSTTDGLNGGAYEIYYENNGTLNVEGTQTSSWGATYTAGDIVGIGLDLDNNKIYFSKNGTWQNSANPSTGTNGVSISSASSTTAGFYFFSFSDNWSGGSVTLSYNFGNGYFGTTAVSSAGTNASGIGIFEYDVPSGGYTALSTKGLNL